MSWVLRLLSIALCAMLTGCYHYRVSAPQVADLSDPVSETKWSLAWGLVQEDASDSSCACMNNGIKEVTASTNLGYTLLSVVTLGIVVPVDVQYVCGKPPVGAPFPDPPRGCPGVVKLDVPPDNPPEETNAEPDEGEL